MKLKKYKIYFIIYLSSIVISLYMFESYLLYNLDQFEVDKLKIKKIYEKNTKKKYEERTKFQYYSDLKKIDSEATVTITPSKFNDPENNIHFLAGKSNSNTIDCNENGYFSVNKSDRYGFNNPNKEWGKKITSFILLGDSFIYGACVNRPNDIASYLRKISKKTVLNLGYKANGPLSMLATLKEYMPKNTKNVLWFYFEGNDLEDLQFELKISILKNYYENASFNQELRFKQKTIDSKINQIIEKSIILEDKITNQVRKNAKTKYKILKFIRLNETKKIIKSLSNLNKKEKIPFYEFKKTLKMAKNFSDEMNSNLYFVYLPQFERYNKGVSEDKYLLVKSIVNELNINFIDVHKGLFLNEKDPLKLFPFEMVGHYNEYGYKKISNFIFQKIKNGD